MLFFSFPTSVTLMAVMLKRWRILTVSYCCITSTYKILVAMRIYSPCICSLAEVAPLGWVLLGWCFKPSIWLGLMVKR